LCAARTGAPDSGFNGISLFLVDLHADGVRRTTIGSIADEQFHRIELDGVRVPAGDLLGEVNKGWPLVTECLAIERTGLDYTLRAELWLTAACEILAAGAGDNVAVDDAVLEEIGRHGAAAAASRLMAWRVLAGLEADRVDEVASAAAKLLASETAQRIATWSATRIVASGDGRPLPAAAARTLEAAYREAPGTTVSAGSTQMMLQIIANLALDGVDKEARAS
jgi:alkylation response protein AidB-like acyl-CoA dehydrogenase